MLIYLLWSSNKISEISDAADRKDKVNELMMARFSEKVNENAIDIERNNLVIRPFSALFFCNGFPVSNTFE